MTVLCRSYASHPEAVQAVDAVLETGIPGSSVRVLMGEPIRDARTEVTGQFAGPVAPGAPVGHFAGASTAGGPTGAFAGGEQRGGSFADADREVVTDYPGGVERTHVAGHQRLKRLLTDAGLDEAAAERDIRALHEGRILVLVDLAEGDPDAVRSALEGTGG